MRQHDTNFYAAVVGDKVYLVNKMNIRDMDDAYQEVLNVDTDAEADTTVTPTETETPEN